MNDLKKIKLGEILTESKVEAIDSSADKRIRVLLGVRGVVKRPIMKETSGATKYFLRKKGQFIYGKQNMHKGAFGIIPENLDGYSSSSDLPAFDVDKSCLPEWIIYFLRQNNFYLSLVDIAKGAATKRIQPKALFEVEIPLPSLDIQASLINNFKIIEGKYKKILSEIFIQKDLLLNLKQSILQEAIEGKLTKDWRKKNLSNSSVSKNYNKIDNQNLNLKIPKSWRWIYISEAADLSTGNSINKSLKDIKYSKTREGLDYIGTKDVYFKFEGINYDTGVKIPDDELKSKFKVAEPFTILVCIEGGSSGKKIAMTDRSVCYGNKLLAVQPDDISISPYLFYLFQSPHFKKEFDLNRKGLRGGVSISSFKKIRIPIPPIEEQKEIVSKIKTLMQKLNLLEAEIKTSEANAEMLMQSVLNEAFEN